MVERVKYGNCTRCKCLLRPTDTYWVDDEPHCGKCKWKITCSKCGVLLRAREYDMCKACHEEEDD